jgi:simple sugar transport system permease protein
MEVVLVAITVLHFATPVAFAAIGEAVGQRSGVINIGLEGMMLVAAYFAMLASLGSGSPWIGLVAGVGAAVVLGVVQSFFTLKLAADQIVVGTAVNLFALGLTDTLFRAKFGRTPSLISVPTLPKLYGDLDVAVLALLAVTAFFAWMLARTKRGLVVRAAGEYPETVDAAGFSALKTRFWSLVAGAVLAGFGGAYLAVGVTGSFASGMSGGRGFVAIALVTFGRWRPAWVLAAALLVGYSESIQYTLQVRNLSVPGELLQSLPYLVALAVLVLVGKGTAMPAMLAVPYRREK